MGIQLVVAGLTYFALLVLAFGLTQLLKLEEDRCEEIAIKAFNNTYITLAFGFLVVYALVVIPSITVDYVTTSYLILTSKFVSLITLGSSLYWLSEKEGKT